MAHCIVHVDRVGGCQVHGPREAQGQEAISVGDLATGEAGRGEGLETLKELVNGGGVERLEGRGDGTSA
jgi:hypothetical protein